MKIKPLLHQVRRCGRLRKGWNHEEVWSEVLLRSNQERSQANQAVEQLYEATQAIPLLGTLKQFTLNTNVQGYGFVEFGVVEHHEQWLPSPINTSMGPFLIPLLTLKVTA